MAIPAAINEKTKGPTRTTGYHHHRTRHRTSRRPRSRTPARPYRSAAQTSAVIAGIQVHNRPTTPTGKPMALGIQTTQVSAKVIKKKTSASYRRSVFRHAEASEAGADLIVMLILLDVGPA